jgi:hypothetical protein
MKFYSEKLNKMFDTEKELLKEEEAAFKAEQEAKAKSLAKKTEAKVVEDAFKAHNAAKKAFNTVLTARRKKYAEDLATLKATYESDVEAERKKLDEAANAYDKVLKEFNAKHPEGFHMTLKDGDNVVTMHSTGGRDALATLINEN